MTTMVKTGTVIKNDNGNLLINVARPEACGACAAKDACGNKEGTMINVHSTEDLKPGDKVIVQSDSSDITKYSVYVYVLPVVMMIIGAIIPNALFKNTSMDINLLTLLFIIGFLLISFAIIKGVDKKIKNKNVVKVKKA